jgi:hypothetical protein
MPKIIKFINLQKTPTHPRVYKTKQQQQQQQQQQNCYKTTS